VPNFVVIGQNVAEILQFTAIFKMAAVRHFEFFYEFEILAADRSVCALMPNFRAIGVPITEIRRFFDVQNGGYPPSWIIRNSQF